MKYCTQNYIRIITNSSAIWVAKIFRSKIHNHSHSELRLVSAIIAQHVVLPFFNDYGILERDFTFLNTSQILSFRIATP